MPGISKSESIKVILGLRQLLTLLQTNWSCLISSSKSITFFKSSLASSSAIKAFSASKSVVSSAFCYERIIFEVEIIWLNNWF